MGIIVLGMHRSGTSLAMRILSLMGCNLGPREALLLPAPDNPGGFFERLDVRRTNDRLLAALGRSWLDCLEVRVGDLAESEIAEFSWSAEKIVNELDSEGSWAMKDPRFCLVLDAWMPFIDDPICVLAHRGPMASALSLHERDGVGIDMGLALWERYNLSALRTTKDCPRVSLAFEDLLLDPKKSTEELLGQLSELGAKGLHMPSQEELVGVVDRSLDHHGQSQIGGAATVLRGSLTKLSTSFREGAAFGVDAPDLSVESAEILSGASSRWPGQVQITRLLKQRDAEVALLREKLRKVEFDLASLGKGASRGADSRESQSIRRSPGVFIVGSPRSGTSVFSWTLAAHPNFATSAESDYLLDLLGAGHLHASYKRAYARPDEGWLRRMKVGYREFAAFVGLGIEQLYESRFDGRRWVDATPGYTLMGEDLILLFPAAKFLHILRDGRAVVNSMILTGFDTEWASDFATACEAWAHYASSGRNLVEKHPGRVLEVRYESLVAETESDLRRVFEFLNEKPSGESVKLISTKRINSSYGNIEKADIRKTKDPADAPDRPWADWSEDQKLTFRRLAGPAMARLGYDIDSEGPWVLKG